MSTPPDKRTGDQEIALNSFRLKIPRGNNNNLTANKDQQKKDSHRARKAKVEQNENPKPDAHTSQDSTNFEERYRYDDRYDHHDPSYPNQDNHYQYQQNEPPMPDSYARRAGHGGGYGRGDGYHNKQTRFHPSSFRGRGHGRGRGGYNNHHY